MERSYRGDLMCTILDELMLSSPDVRPKDGTLLTRGTDVYHPRQADWCTAFQMYNPRMKRSCRGDLMRTILDELMYNPLDVQPQLMHIPRQTTV